MVFAYHTEDPASENDIEQHTFRGSRSILLLNNVDKKRINEEGWGNFVLQARNVSLKFIFRLYHISAYLTEDDKDGDYDRDNGDDDGNDTMTMIMTTTAMVTI